jgi:hypothetical protein
VKCLASRLHRTAQRVCPLQEANAAANFDIYLPNWLARNNKAIFGTLFALNGLIVLWRWLAQP